VKTLALIFLSVVLVASLILGVSCSSSPVTTTATTTATKTTTSTATTTATTTATATATKTATKTETTVVRPVNLTFANWAPPENDQSVACKKWATDFEEKTGGRYHVEVVDGGALVNNGGSYDAVISGIADIAVFAPKESQHPFPLFVMSTLPVGFSTCVDGTKVYTKIMSNGAFDKEFADIVPLFTFLGNNEDVSTKVPVNSVAEFKGMKLVVPGGLQVDVCQAVGAVPVMGGPPDAYELVSKGVADGIYIAALGMQEFNWVDLVKYLIKPMQFGKASHLAAMNKEVYNKMPADVQAIVTEMAKDPQYGMIVAKGWDDWWTGAIAYFHEKGGTDIDWTQAEKDKLGALIQPMWENWLTKNDSLGSRAALTAYYNEMKAMGYDNPTPGWAP
jgi:TRAP-type C4-dicarboxylate transport system substrate-binding protein